MKARIAAALPLAAPPLALLLLLALGGCSQGHIFGEVHTRFGFFENASLFYHAPTDQNPQRVVRLDYSHGGEINMMANDVLSPASLAETECLDVGVDNLLDSLETGLLRVSLDGPDAAKFKLYLFNYSPDPQNPTLVPAASGWVDVPSVMPGASRRNCFRIMPVSSAIAAPGVPETWTAWVNVNSLTRDLSMSFPVTLYLDDPMRNQAFTLSWYGDGGLVWTGPALTGGEYRLSCAHQSLGSPLASGGSIEYYAENPATGSLESAPAWTGAGLYGADAVNGEFVFRAGAWPLTGELTVYARLEFPLPSGGTEHLGGYCVIKPDRTQGASQ